jgi:hypothetical protein
MLSTISHSKEMTGVGKNITGFLTTMFPLIHCSMSSRMSQKKNSDLPQPLYNPEVSPSDSTLFPKFKVSLKGCSVETAEEIQENWWERKKMTLELFY